MMQKDSNKQMELIKKYFDKNQWFFLLVRIGQGHCARVVLCYCFDEKKNYEEEDNHYWRWVCRVERGREIVRSPAFRGNSSRCK
jgi:hypothetical protein